MPIIDLGPIVPMALAFVALACVIIAAGWDITRFEIPDELSLLLVALAVFYGLITPNFNWLWHALAPVGVFAIGLAVFSRGWMGGGDIKLLTAIAAWTGLGGLLPLFIGMALSGGILAFVLIVARRAYADRPGPRIFARDAPLPYAVAILGGTLYWASFVWPGNWPLY